jgi:hypothetical protein
VVALSTVSRRPAATEVKVRARLIIAVTVVAVG